jgi:hypothetical protein
VTIPRGIPPPKKKSNRSQPVLKYSKSFHRSHPIIKKGNVIFLLVEYKEIVKTERGAKTYE